MKRGGPLQRRTPLQQGTGLPASRSRIKPKRSTPRRRSRVDHDEIHGVWAWADTRLTIWNRAAGRCELCGSPVSVDQMEGHHRLSRRLGPDCPCNALALCSSCHHGPDVHGNVDGTARDRGRIVSMHDQRNPFEVPVELASGRVTTLTCGGGYGA